MNDYINSTNIPMPPQSGVYNSFIAPISTEDIETKPKKDIIRGFLILAFILTILLAVSAFVYTKMLNSQVNTYKNQLFAYDSAVPVTTFENNLQDIRLLSQKLKLINSVYDNKLYVAGMLLPSLESIVESSPTSYVYFNNFNLKKDNSSKFVSISLSGVAVDYLSLYRQINNFKKNPLFLNFKLASLSLDQYSNVNFSVTFDTNISTAEYLNYLNLQISAMNASGTPLKTGSGPLFKLNSSTNVIPPISTTTNNPSLNNVSASTTSNNPINGNINVNTN